MDQETFQRVRRIFDAASKLPVEERDRFLRVACADAPEIRAEVERLLAADLSDQPASIEVERTVHADPSTQPTSVEGEGSTWTEGPPAADPEGRRIGPYRILRTLGEGGMGIVFEAEQEYPVKRRVALKLIKHGLAGDKVLARFDAERQALALMSHPNVARVLDAGNDEDGQPYFVMEFIKGVPITDYCNLNNLRTRDRLQLMIQVCDGVQHAHQKGIIHRDLKPSNILIEMQDGKPAPKIIDFGVAKAIDRQLTEMTLFTEFGQIVGTPEYMSPEQAEMSVLDIDTRTDVYALGVVLYEILVGELPFTSKELRKAGFEGMRRVIREVTPAKPSTRIQSLGPKSGEAARQRSSDPGTHERGCRGDLDWITMKALEKDRTQRYASVSDFSADLLRHLRNEPVSAGPPSVGYRARKFVRRHRAGVTFATALSVAIVAGLIGTSLALMRAVRAEKQTRLEADTVRAVSDFMTGMFEINDPSEARGRSITAKEVLDRGATRIGTELGDKPDLKARLMETMGKVYRSLGLYEEAHPLLDGAVLEQSRAHGPDSPEAARAKTTYAGNLIKEGKIDEAIPILEDVLKVQRQALDPGDVELARTLNNLGNCYRVRGRYADALPLLEQALAIREQALGPNHADVAKQLDNVGAVRTRLKDFAGARRDLERALAIREKLYGPDHVTVGYMLNTLAMLYRDSHDLPGAKAAAEHALAIEEKALGPDNAVLVNPLTVLGMIARDQGDLAGSETVLRRALVIAEAKLDPEQLDYRQAEDELAATLEAKEEGAKPVRR